MIYLYLFGTCFHFIYVFMIIGNKLTANITNIKNRNSFMFNSFIILPYNTQ